MWIRASGDAIISGGESFVKFGDVSCLNVFCVFIPSRSVFCLILTIRCRIGPLSHSRQNKDLRVVPSQTSCCSDNTSDGVFPESFPVDLLAGSRVVSILAFPPLYPTRSVKQNP